VGGDAACFGEQQPEYGLSVVPAPEQSDMSPGLGRQLWVLSFRFAENDL
jgi:hypothetical protein